MSEQEQIELLNTVVACLVQELCCANHALGKGRVAPIKEADIWNPPEIESEYDRYTGDWIYRLTTGGTGE